MESFYHPRSFADGCTGWTGLDLQGWLPRGQSGSELSSSSLVQNQQSIPPPCFHNTNWLPLVLRHWTRCCMCVGVYLKELWVSEIRNLHNILAYWVTWIHTHMGVMSLISQLLNQELFWGSRGKHCLSSETYNKEPSCYYMVLKICSLTSILVTLTSSIKQRHFQPVHISLRRHWCRLSHSQRLILV